MKVLFLDFDGVLNSVHHAILLHNEHDEFEEATTLLGADVNRMMKDTAEYNRLCLKYLLKQVPDLKICVSSAWRNHYSDEAFMEFFKRMGVNRDVYLGKTPRVFQKSRGIEIREFLEAQSSLHPITQFAVVDDHIVSIDNFFQTDYVDGLTMHKTYEIIRHFNPEWREPIVLM